MVAGLLVGQELLVESDLQNAIDWVTVSQHSLHGATGAWYQTTFGNGMTE